MPTAFPPPNTLLEKISLSIIQTLARKNKVSIYLVGGALRDFILGRPSCDFDFAVSRNALKVARQFADQIKGSYVLLDQEHGCARVIKKKGEETFIYDFADFRQKTLKGDLYHRDFTLNTLCVDIAGLKTAVELNEILVDPHGGLKDISRKKIRMTSAKSFVDDPLRVLRAFSLKAQLGFAIENETLRQLKNDQHRLREVAWERKREELFKILAAPQTAEHFKAMDKIGLLSELIPQITVMYKVTQGGYHHLDVWPHSLETVAQLEGVFAQFHNDPDIKDYLNEDLGGDHKRFTIMKFAALLHDIGKPETKKVEPERTSFHGHEKVGKDIVRKIGKMLKISTRERYALEDMVYWHLRPGYLSNFKSPSPRSVFRYFRDTKDEAVAILLLSLADQRSTRGPLTTEDDQRHHEKIVKKLIQQKIAEWHTEPFVRLIDGHDVLRRLKIKPSPLVGKILKKVEEQQVLGKIKTKKEALELAVRIGTKAG